MKVVAEKNPRDNLQSTAWRTGVPRAGSQDTPEPVNIRRKRPFSVLQIRLPSAASQEKGPLSEARWLNVHTYI